MKQGMEIEAMKNILVHMAKEQASSRLEANPDEVSHLFQQSYIYSGTSQVFENLSVTLKHFF